jgi:catechol 2,3-dioxygenase-like lactoylglutathione lyase family enzyme
MRMMSLVVAAAAVGLQVSAANASCGPSLADVGCFVPERDGPTTFPNAATPDQPLKLHHITMFSNNHERLAEWYRDMLGFEIAGRFDARRPDGVVINIIRLTMGGVWLNISRLPGLTERDRQLEYAGWRHLAFGTGDVQRAWEQLRARGADVVGRGPVTFDPPGYQVAFVRDPDGNFIEFYKDLRAPAF